MTEPKAIDIAGRYVRQKFTDLRAILLFDLKHIFYPPLVVPVLLWAVLAGLVNAGYLPDAHSRGGERIIDIADSVSLYVLWAAVAAASLRLAAQREWYFLWLTALVGTLLIREYHFEWANIYAHVAVPVIFAAAWLCYRPMETYLATRTVVTLVFLGFFCYVISQSLDQRAWRFLPGENDWEKIVEELVENAGHLCFLLLAILSHRRSSTAGPLDATADA